MKQEEDSKQLDKEEKLARLSFKRLSNSLRMDYSMKKIHTMKDYLEAVGDENIIHYNQQELSRVLSFADLKELIDDRRISLETKLWLKRNPPLPDTEVYETIDNKGTVQSSDRQTSIDLSLVTSSHDEQHDKDYGLWPSEKERCKLFWFQKKYAKQALDNILVHHKNGQMLIAGAGNGKTFILGAILRRLLDRNFHVGKTISPWPYFYITKASVVEQTKRVLANHFSIDLVTEVTVTNYDQLRATLGTMYLTEKTIVENNQEHIIWEWRDKIHPCVFVIDESQAAKNRDSTQSKIIRAISRIKNPNVFVIFSSATPFVTVAEAEYFVVNARIHDEN